MVVLETNIDMKQTDDDNQYIHSLKITDTLQGDTTLIVPSPWG